MAPSSSGMPAEHRIDVVADTAQLASIRAQVAELARQSGANDDIVGQFEVVVSELATNIIQHSGGTHVSVVFRSSPHQWELDVSNPPTSGELAAAHLPDSNESTGRGLSIVRALMDSVEVVEVDGSQHIRCIKLAG